jgi:hypothetical protein
MSWPPHNGAPAGTRLARGARSLGARRPVRGVRPGRVSGNHPQSGRRRSVIAKITRGSSFTGAARYILDERRGLDHDHQPEIVAGNMASRTSGELTREFEAVRQQRPDMQKPVEHVAVSFARRPTPRQRRDGQARRRLHQAARLRPRPVPVRRHPPPRQGTPALPHLAQPAWRPCLESRARDGWPKIRLRPICSERIHAVLGLLAIEFDVPVVWPRLRGREEILLTQDQAEPYCRLPSAYEPRRQPALRGTRRPCWMPIARDR